MKYFLLLTIGLTSGYLRAQNLSDNDAFGLFKEILRCPDLKITDQNRAAYELEAEARISELKTKYEMLHEEILGSPDSAEYVALLTKPLMFSPAYLRLKAIHEEQQNERVAATREHREPKYRQMKPEFLDKLLAAYESDSPKDVAKLWLKSTKPGNTATVVLRTDRDPLAQRLEDARSATLPSVIDGLREEALASYDFAGKVYNPDYARASLEQLIDDSVTAATLSRQAAKDSERAAVSRRFFRLSGHDSDIRELPGQNQ